MIDKLQRDGFRLKWLRHRDLSAFENIREFAEKISNSRLDRGRKIRADINLRDVLFDGGCGLSFIGLPPSAQRLFPDKALQGLPLLLPMLVDADAKSIEAGYAQQHVARSGQLFRGCDESRDAKDFSFLVRELSGCLPG
jgi:hypothetical protein